MLRDRWQQTIVATITPPGRGGVSVIRVSGQAALAITRKSCAFLPSQPETNKIYYGFFKEQNGQDIDEVLVSYFAKGHSYTGEETTEISCHGNPQICSRIIDNLVKQGASIAERGEFTYRAFLSNRIDLIQAENVLALIESNSQASARSALEQIKGHLSKKLNRIRENLTWCLAQIEAGIDFSSEGIDVVDMKTMLTKLDQTTLEISKLISTYNFGKKIKEGINVVIVGEPNVGKSSLLNFLLEDEKAIVTDIAGTTRDVVEGICHYKNVHINLYDTAGLRETLDVVEKIGIEKSKQKLTEADVLIFVFDAVDILKAGKYNLGQVDFINSVDLPKAVKKVAIVNKSDLLSDAEKRQLESNVIKHLSYEKNSGFFSTAPLFISALDPSARHHVLDCIIDDSIDFSRAEDSVITHERHKESLVLAGDFVKQAKAALEQAVGEEFIALELKEALLEIHKILGIVFDDQIMDKVFKEFCIGK